MNLVLAIVVIIAVLIVAYILQNSGVVGGRPGAGGFLRGLVEQYQKSRFIMLADEPRLRSFFPPGGGPGIRVTPEGIYSITTPRVAAHTAALLRREVPDADTITDGTSGMGGNVIQFSRVFRHVNAIELSDDNYEALASNTAAYRLNNVKLHHGDCLKIVPELVQDIIFIDPPWTGLDYRNQERLALHLGGIDIGVVVAGWLDRARLVAVKVPANFDTDGFRQHVPRCRSVRIGGAHPYLMLLCRGTAVKK